jgi:DNA (cytosine-5)-methyltransferase 3A
LNVLSLFDGISCGHVALDRANIPVENYFASEIEKNAITITQKNYPNTIQLGDITKITNEHIKNLCSIDIVIGGSPCTDLSNYKYYMQDVTGLDGSQSGLFYDFVRILKCANPKYFLLENVASMEDRWKDLMSEILGYNPIMINSADFCAAERKRYYWTNIPIKRWNHKDVVLKDIIVDSKDVPDKYWYSKYAVTVYNGDPKVKATIHINAHRHAKEVYSINHKCNTIMCDDGGGNLVKKIYQDGRVRKLMPLEYERLQTLPDNYTDCVSDSARYSAIGNGWTVDVISHILSGINLTDTKDCYLCGKYLKRRLF